MRDASEGVRPEGPSPSAPQYFVRVSPGAVAVRFAGGQVERNAVELRDADGAHGAWAIKGFSERSRRRMLLRFASIDWSTVGPRLVMVTLTYGQDWPRDGRLVKKQLDRFSQRWRERWGVPHPQAVWALEFQERGAPHFHIYAGMVEASAEVFGEWCRAAWYEIVGSEDRAHLVHGAHVQECRFGTQGENMGRIAEYFWKHNAKRREHYQKQVPDDFERPGRFWGCWGVEPAEYELEVSRAVYVQTRRALRDLRKARRGKQFQGRMPSGMRGTFAIVSDGLTTGVRLVEWYGSEEP